MKKITPKSQPVSILSLTIPKFTVKTLFKLFTTIFILVQIYYGYEIYILLNKIFHLFSNVTNFNIQFSIFNFLSEFYFSFQEVQQRLLEKIRILKLIILESKKLPVLLLYLFFTLIIFNYFFIPNFESFTFILVGIEHLLLHKVFHFLQYQKRNKWYYCICWINKIKRKIK